MIEFRNLTRKRIDTKIFRKLGGKIFPPAGWAGKNKFNVSLVFASPALMRKLHKNKNADALSFLYKEERVGEIFLNAAEKNLPYLFVHSALHLLGFNHKRSGDAKKMESRELKILNSK